MRFASVQQSAVLIAGALAVSLAALAGAPPATAQDLKVAVFDKQRIVDESRLGAATRARFEKQQKEAENEVIEKQKAFEAIQASYQQKAQALSEEKRLELQRQVAKARDEFQAVAQNADRDLQRAYQQSLLDIVKKMDPIILAFAEEKGYDLMFDQTQFVYGAKALDVTNQIIARLDAAHP